MLFPVVILAGGLGSRLHPLTYTIPKSLVAVNGEPFIIQQLNLLKTHGIDRVIVCTGHLGEKIRAVVEQVSSIHVEVVSDGKHLLGTAGALRAASSIIGDPFFVLYGDSYLPCDYAAIQHAFERSEKSTLMTVCREYERANAYYKNDKILLYDKNRQTPLMRHIDYGLSIVSRETLDHSQAADLADVFCEVSKHGMLAGYVNSERYHSIGSFEGLAETRRYIQTHE